MFTAEEIKAAHSKVKSGADFQNYIKDLVKLGVTSYETYVSDGHTDYQGSNDYFIFTEPKYEKLIIAAQSSIAQFKADLKAHQQGKTDYPTFCKDCAHSGVEKWVVDILQMTCTYFDKAGNSLLVEKIPQ